MEKYDGVKYIKRHKLEPDKLFFWELSLKNKSPVSEIAPRCRFAEWWMSEIQNKPNFLFISRFFKLSINELKTLLHFSSDDITNVSNDSVCKMYLRC